MQSAKYPSKFMNLTQGYAVKSGSHADYYNGSPKSYPIDDICESLSSKSEFLAPFDCIIKRFYTAGTNSVWLQSKDKVKLANGKESFVTVMVLHVVDADLKKYKVGQAVKQGTVMFKEGNDGAPKGYHFHIECAACEFSKLGNNGWKKNSKGAWVISNNQIAPEEVFFIDKSITKIKQSKGLKFKDLPTEEVKEEPKPTTSTPVETTSYYPKCSYKGNSIVDGLKSIKVDSSFTNRLKIANKNGITGYKGSASQNTQMLNLLKQGKLKKA